MSDKILAAVLAGVVAAWALVFGFRVNASFNQNTYRQETVTLFVGGPDVAHGAIASCSGSIIGDGLILTARHCVLSDIINTQSNRNAIWARTFDGKTVLTSLAFISEDTDFAVLHATGLNEPTASLSCSAVKVGDAVTVVGSPLGFLDWAVSQGQVATLDTDADVFAIKSNGTTLGEMGWNHLAITTAPIMPGDSGGPVFNTSGQVVGVVVAGAGSYGGFVPATDICAELPRL